MVAANLANRMVAANLANRMVAANPANRTKYVSRVNRMVAANPANRAKYVSRANRMVAAAGLAPNTAVASQSDARAMHVYTTRVNLVLTQRKRSTI